MAARKGGLGKGLDSLIPETIKTTQPGKEKIVEKVVEKIVEKPIELKVKISKVGPNKDQPRKQFDEDALMELADSIKQFGIIQPLIVQEKNGFYEIIAGERRWRAAKLAGLKEGLTAALEMDSNRVAIAGNNFRTSAFPMNTI